MATSQSGARQTALVYARKSVVRNKRDEVSPERQVALCSEVAAQRGRSIEVYLDAAGHRSADSEKHRPEWRRLKQQLARPDVVAVVVGDLTRASRSPKDFFLFLDECSRRGVQFIAIRDNIDTTTANGRVMLGILIAHAAWEREISSERVLTAINFKCDRGLHVGNSPLGCRRDEQVRLMESADWQTCQHVLEQYATGNFTFYSLAQRLNADGLRFRNRKGEPVPFDRSNVRSIVSNILTYCGFVIVKHAKDMSLPRVLDEQDPIGALAEHVGAIRAQHAPLISSELAARVIRARHKVMRPKGPLERPGYILIPALHCAHCGAPRRAQKLYGRPRYVHQGKSCQAHGHAIEAEGLDRQVFERLRQVRLPNEKRAELKRRVEDKLRDMPEHAEVTATIRSLELKAERLKQLYIEGDIAREQYDAQKHATLSAIAEQRAKLGPRAFSLDAVLAQIDSIADILAHGTPVQQRRAIGDLFEQIQVDFEGRISTMLPRDWAEMILSESPQPK